MPFEPTAMGGAHRRLARLVGLAAAALTALSITTARAEVIEHVIAVVDGRPVMLSEVQLSARLLGVARDAALEAVIDERLMLEDAQRLTRVGDEQTAFESLRARLGEPHLSADTEAELRRLARRQATILRYIEFRFEPQVRVGAARLRSAYEAEYGGRDDRPSFDSVAAELRAKLERQQLDARIEAWVRDLRAAAEIRYNPNP
jgi:hypothetical protein